MSFLDAKVQLEDFAKKWETVHSSKQTASPQYFGHHFELVAKDEGISEATITAQFTRLLDTFLKQADFYAKATTDAMLKIGAQLLPIHDPTYQNLVRVMCNLQFIRENHLPSHLITRGNSPVYSAPTPIPEGVSYASIIVETERKDKVMENFALSVLQDGTPLICASRLVPNIILQLQQTSFNPDAWSIFTNTTGTLIILLPKENAGPPEAYLKRLGYAPSLIPLTWEGLSKAIAQNEKASSEEYAEMLTRDLPDLLSPGSSVRRRFHFCGHGSSVPIAKDDTRLQADIKKELGEGRMAGLTLAQFKRVLQTLDRLGVEYINCLSCYAGGRNLLKVLDFRPRFTVSVCAADDYPVTALINPSEQLSIRQVNLRLFWERIHALFTSRVTLQPHHFKDALENIYGHVLTALPSVLIPGRRSFDIVNVHQRATIVRYEDLRQLAQTPNPMITVNNDMICIYPQIVPFSMTISRHSPDSRFPAIVSKIPDHSFTMLQLIRTLDGSPKEILADSLLDRFNDLGLDIPKGKLIWTEYTICIKEIHGMENSSPSIYRNVIVQATACVSKGLLSSAIYQKEGSEQWYHLDSVDPSSETPIEPEAVTMQLYGLIKKSRVSKEALEFSVGDVREAIQTPDDVAAYLRTHFLSTGQAELIAALDAIEENQVAQFTKIAFTLSPRQCKELLFYLISKEAVLFIEALIPMDCQILECNADGDPPLIAAVKTKNPVPIARALIAMGANLNAGCRIGIRPLLWALATDHSELVELLCNSRADINTLARFIFQNSVGFCLNTNRPGLAEQLMKHGADLTLATYNTNKQKVTADIPRDQLYLYLAFDPALGSHILRYRPADFVAALQPSEHEREQSLLCLAVAKGFKNLAKQMMAQYAAPCLSEKRLDKITVIGMFSSTLKTHPIETIIKSRDDELFAVFLSAAADEMKIEVEAQRKDGADVEAVTPRYLQGLFYIRFTTQLAQAVTPLIPHLTPGMKELLKEFLQEAGREISQVVLPSDADLKKWQAEWGMNHPNDDDPEFNSMMAFENLTNSVQWFQNWLAHAQSAISTLLPLIS